jgi:hypothetical protein
MEHWWNDTDRENRTTLKKPHSKVITLSFLRGINEISALLFIYRRIGTRRNLECLTLQDGKYKLSRNVGNYQSTLRNIPEGRRSLYNAYHKTNVE